MAEKEEWQPVELPVTTQMHRLMEAMLMAVDPTLERGPYTFCRRVKVAVPAVLDVDMVVDISHLILLVKDARFNGYLPDANFALIDRVEKWIEKDARTDAGQ